jgi:hypothetical protein
MPPKRTVTPRQDSPPFAYSRLCCCLRKRLTATLPTGGFECRGPRRVGPGRARDACDRLLYVSAHVSAHAGSRPSTTICIRPLAIRRSLVPGRPFCPAAASRHARVNFGRPDQSSTRRYRRLPCFAMSVLPCLCAKLVLPGEAESALQACNRRGIPRPTAHQRCWAPEATVSGAVLYSLSKPSAPQAAGSFTLGLISLERQSTNLAPAGTSPRSRYFHKAMNNLRATATTPIFRAAPLPVPNRRAYH